LLDVNDDSGAMAMAAATRLRDDNSNGERNGGVKTNTTIKQ
jgi:hypothetical protein